MKYKYKKKYLRSLEKSLVLRVHNLFQVVMIVYFMKPLQYNNGYFLDKNLCDVA